MERQSSLRLQLTVSKLHSRGVLLPKSSTGNRPEFPSVLLLFAPQMMAFIAYFTVSYRIYHGRNDLSFLTGDNFAFRLISQRFTMSEIVFQGLECQN